MSALVSLKVNANLKLNGNTNERGSRVFQMLVSFNHLVEIKTVNRWMAAFVLGFYFFMKSSNAGFSLLPFSLGLLSIFLVLCYVMVINDCFDVEDDKIKSRFTGKKLVVSKEISVKNALILSVVMLILGLATAVIVSRMFLVVVFLIILLSSLYSVPPIRYKRLFPLSTLGEFVGAFLPFMSGYVVCGGLEAKPLIVSAFFALITMYWRFYHEALFSRVDRLTGKMTFGVIYGSKVSRALGRLCLLAALLEAATLFVLGWFTLDFLLLLGLYVLLTFGFWYYLSEYIPRFVENTIGPIWGILFVLLVVALLISA